MKQENFEIGKKVLTDGLDHALLIGVNQKSSPAGLVLEFEMARHFDTKQKSY